ncbi:hypothetical protein [Rhodococcus triatomae]|nr:hypothetical protein G419_25347 [Rhodococcus triatomae BKS 15-14]
MTHPAFPYDDWPADMHPMAWVFLHPPTDVEAGSMPINLNAQLMNAFAKHLFDDLGATLPATEPRTEELTITITKKDVGQVFDKLIDDTAPVHVIRGALPPGLVLSHGRISGTALQTSVSMLTLQIGPQVHYQRSLNGGPLSNHNPGRWVDIRKPLEAPPTLPTLADLGSDEANALRNLSDEQAAAIRALLDARDEQRATTPEEVQ